MDEVEPPRIYIAEASCGTLPGLWARLKGYGRHPSEVFLAAARALYSAYVIEASVSPRRLRLVVRVLETRETRGTDRQREGAVQATWIALDGLRFALRTEAGFCSGNWDDRGPLPGPVRVLVRQENQEAA